MHTPTFEAGYEVDEDFDYTTMLLIHGRSSLPPVQVAIFYMLDPITVTVNCFEETLSSRRARVAFVKQLQRSSYNLDDMEESTSYHLVLPSRDHKQIDLGANMV